MPKGYYTGQDGKIYHPGPPRKGTINQRAQRFRTKAGCIEWRKRQGTHAKNEKILSYLPESCKDPAVNSTKGFRDLNKTEQAEVEAQNKGSKKWKKPDKEGEEEKDEEEKEERVETGGIGNHDEEIPNEYEYSYINDGEDEEYTLVEGDEMSHGVQDDFNNRVGQGQMSQRVSKQAGTAITMSKRKGGAHNNHHQHTPTSKYAKLRFKSIPATAPSTRMNHRSAKGRSDARSSSCKAADLTNGSQMSAASAQNRFGQMSTP